MRKEKKKKKIKKEKSCGFLDTTFEILLEFIRFLFYMLPKAGAGAGFVPPWPPAATFL